MTQPSSKAIHVLHVVPGLGAGGMELAMARVVSGLSGSDMRHSIVCLKGEPEIADRLPDETEIHCLHSRPNEPQLPLRLGKLIRRVRPDVIHARNWGAWPEVTVGRFFAWPVMPLIYSFHGLGKADYMPWRRRLASYMLVRMTTHLFAVSEVSKQLMIDKWGWPSRGVDVIPNGVDTEVFQPVERTGKRDEMTDDGHCRAVVGTVGNLRPVKNHALLIKACAALAKSGVELELRIAGEGEERARLLELAESLGFADRLTLGGLVSNVPEFLRALDVFVLSSDSEQHPNALIEAMACGIPCIATRVGSVEEVLEKGLCGRIIEPGDQTALTEQLRALLGDSNMLAELSAAGREQVCRRYDVERMFKAYENMYRRVAGGKGMS